MNKSMLIALLLCAYFMLPQSAFADKNEAKAKIDKILKESKADVGVAIVSIEDHDTLYLNTGHYPMQSVYKFPLAIAVLHQMEGRKLSFNYPVHVTKKDLAPFSKTALKEKCPTGEGDVSLGDLINYSISQSDNAACDILFRLVGGPVEVDKYIHSLGVPQIAIVATEEQMHQDWQVQFTNWCEPAGMLQLLNVFYEKHPLSMVNRGYLLKAMVEANTGPNRLRAGLPDKTVLAHKTGSSDTKDGITAATNDVGIVTLPNGKHFAIVVFVSNSKASEKENESTIAQIAKAAWEYYGK